jgi:hypothetical protein
VSRERLSVAAQVIEARAAWSHYEYILVRNEIIVINPATFEINHGLAGVTLQ